MAHSNVADEADLPPTRSFFSAHVTGLLGVHCIKNILEGSSSYTWLLASNSLVASCSDIRLRTYVLARTVQHFPSSDL